MAYVRYILAALALVGTLAACESDPYMARKGGYTPGTYVWPGDRSANYTTQSAYYRNCKGIHPASEM